MSSGRNVSEITGNLGGPRPDDATSAPVPSGVGPETGRWLRRHLAGGVVAVTTVTDRGFRATTVSAALVASIEPLQALISMERDSQMEEWLLESRSFAVSILPWRQKLLADQFAGLAPLASSTFAGIDFFTASTGCPIIRAAIGWMDCALVTDVVTGDHRLLVGDVLAAGEGALSEAEPLIYYRNRYLRVE